MFLSRLRGHGSFIGAAEELAVSPGAVSYQMMFALKAMATILCTVIAPGVVQRFCDFVIG